MSGRHRDVCSHQGLPGIPRRDIQLSLSMTGPWRLAGHPGAAIKDRVSKKVSVQNLATADNGDRSSCDHLAVLRLTHFHSSGKF